MIFRRRHNSRRTKKGFILVSTLVLLAISALLLAGFARLSMAKSMQSLRDEQQIQERWAKASLERLAFNNIDELLTKTVAESETEAPTSIPIQRLLIDIELADVRLEAVVANESSKLDANQIFLQKNERELTKALRDIVDPNRISIQLSPNKTLRDAKDQTFVSWGQLVKGRDLLESGLPPEELLRLSAELTLWGKRLCLKSSSDDALRTTSGLVVGDALASRIVNARNSQPGMSMKGLSDELSLNRDQITKLSQVLSDSSISQSIWLKTTHKRSGIQSYYFVVREGFIVGNGAGSTTHRYQVFEW